MEMWAIIPVKSLHLTKSRLSAALSPSERAELTQHLLRCLLLLLSEHPAISQILVVSRDERLQQMAQARGALAIAEGGEADLNEAVRTGAQLAWMGQADRILILPSDLPTLTPSDIDLVCETAVTAPSRAIICPDRHERGTNAISIPLRPDFQFQFGPNSFRRHQGEARRCHQKPLILRTPGWQFDLDTYEDWEIFMAESNYNLPTRCQV